MTVDATTRKWIRNKADEKAAAAGMRFNEKRGEKVCEWIEKYCCLYEGEFAGQSLKLIPFQRDLIMRLFGWVRWSDDWDQWIRRFTHGGLWCSKKNTKALCLETEVPTPTGFRRFGDLRTGDEVFDETGAVCKVTRITQVWNDQSCYRVRFSDGSSVVASEDHLWTVESLRDGYASVTLTTEEIARGVDVVNARGEAWAKNYRIPVAGAVQIADAPLPIEPYTLGVWLGDGDSDTARFVYHNNDKQIVANLAGCGTKVRVQPGSRKRGVMRATLDRSTVGIRDFCGRGHKKHRTPSGTMRCSACGSMAGKARRRGVAIEPAQPQCMSGRLRAANLINNKHIPAVYLSASERQRLALLQGLMDTDGMCSKGGQCSLTTISRRLASDVFTLVASLGWKPLLTSKIARCQTGAESIAYAVQFFAFSDRSCFRLSRKAARLRPPPAKRTRSMVRHIVSVDPVPPVPVRCISVDSPSQQFLVTRSYIATHNSPTLAAIELYMLCGDGEQGQKVYTAAKNGDQAKIAQRHAFEMVRQSPQLSADCKLHASVLSIQHLPTNSVMMILTGDDSRGAKSKEGLNGSVFIDECHVTDFEMMERVGRAGISRKEPLNFAVSTAGDDPSSYGHKRYKDGQDVNNGKRDDLHYLHVEYSAPEKLTEAEIEERLEELGKMANPAWGYVVKPDEFKADWQRSKGSPREVARFKQYRLNLWVGSTNQWLDTIGWELGQRSFTLEDLRGQECYIGLDLSRTRDMTAAAILFPWPEESGSFATAPKDGEGEFEPEREVVDAIRVWPMFWLPEATANDRSKQFPFAEWAQKKAITLIPGRVINDRLVQEDIIEAVEQYELQVKGVYYDLWGGATKFVRELAERIGIDPDDTELPAGDPNKRLHDVRQGMKTMNILAKEFERRVTVGLIQHPGNPVLTWQVGHVEVKADDNQNIRPVKPKPHSGKSIDGIMAMLDAMDGALTAVPCGDGGGFDAW